MIYLEPDRLEGAVTAICPDIEARVALDRPRLDERGLWWELSCCVLSSQVPFGLAVAAADAVEKSGLLLDGRLDVDALTKKLERVLTARLHVDKRLRSYRFPASRARQLALTRLAVTCEAGTIERLAFDGRDVLETRAWLVRHAPGLGPKQSSMFLRNIGASYDLAVLDRHVIDYMSALGIYDGAKRFISDLPAYRRHETVLRTYATRRGFPVGLLDWAIWIVMRASKSCDQELAAA